MNELAVATRSGDLLSALQLGNCALRWAEAENRPILASAVLRAEALVLGSLQRSDTLVQRSALPKAPITSRTTTGTEAHLSGAAIYHALALPRVDALFSDAKARTLLNRNLRLLLRGYTAAGVPLRYFGTEVLALLGHPVALVGYDQVSSGALLIEVLVGLEHPVVVRPALRREPPAALFEVLRQSPDPEELLGRVVQGAAERHGAAFLDVSSELPPLDATEAADAIDTTPTRFPTRAPTGSASIPLGLVEANVEPTVRLGGDLLVSRAALAEVEAATDARLARGQSFDESVLAPLVGAPLDGARPADLLAALQTAALAERG